MKKFILPITILCMLLSFAACDQAPQEGEEELQEDEQLMEEEGVTDENLQQDVTVSAAPDFPQFPNAKLQLQKPEANTNLQPGKVQFNFNVENYQLGKATENAENIMLAKSDKGQHIHFIIDNEPYSAHYESSFEKELSEGNHVVLAFLSRSYHAGLKNKDAFVINQYSVGNTEGGEKIDLSQPHMFYSRPKGTYVGPEQTQKILLDFYLLNTNLSETGNKIRVSVNGQEAETLTEWQPYILEGLPMGENTIKLELLNSEGNLVDSPFNPVTRTITLKEGEGSNL